MCCTGFIKRFLPFALTFAAGLFIASFFVTIGIPKFGSRHRERRQIEMLELRIEVEQLRKEKCDLRRELEEVRTQIGDLDHPDFLEMPDGVDFAIPPPPPVPAVPHRHR